MIRGTGSSLRALSVFDSALPLGLGGIRVQYRVTSGHNSQPASPDDDESCVRSKKASLTLVVDGAMTDNKKAQPDDKIIRMHMYKQFGRVTDWSQVLVVVVLGYIFAIGSSAQNSYSWWPKSTGARDRKRASYICSNVDQVRISSGGG